MAEPSPTPTPSPIGKKAKVKLELQDTSVSVKISDGKAITAAMLLATEFSGITALINEAKDATTDLENAKKAKDIAEEAAQSATATQEHKETAYDTVFTTLANRVDEIAKGDKAIIDKAAMKSFFPGKAAPIGELPQVKNLNLSVGDNEGELDAQWDKIKGASSYTIQRSVEVTTNWVHAGTSTKTSFTLGGLGSGIKMWVRVAAVGSAGQGPWSDPAVRFTP